MTEVECAGLEIQNAEVSPFKAIALFDETVQVTCGDNFETEDAEADYYSQCADSGNWTHSKKCLCRYNIESFLPLLNNTLINNVLILATEHIHITI